MAPSPITHPCRAPSALPSPPSPPFPSVEGSALCPTATSPPCPPAYLTPQVMAAHCGALFLDPRSLAEVGHELCLLEKLYREPHRCAEG